MDGLVNYDSDDDSAGYSDSEKDGYHNRRNKRDEDVNYDNVGMEESSEESNNNHSDSGPSSGRDRRQSCGESKSPSSSHSSWYAGFRNSEPPPFREQSRSSESQNYKNMMGEYHSREERPVDQNSSHSQFNKDMFEEGQTRRSASVSWNREHAEPGYKQGTLTADERNTKQQFDRSHRVFTEDDDRRNVAFKHGSFQDHDERGSKHYEGFSNPGRRESTRRHSSDMDMDDEDEEEQPESWQPTLSRNVQQEADDSKQKFVSKSQENVSKLDGFVTKSDEFHRATTDVDERVVFGSTPFDAKKHKEMVDEKYKDVDYRKRDKERDERKKDEDRRKEDDDRRERRDSDERRREGDRERDRERDRRRDGDRDRRREDRDRERRRSPSDKRKRSHSPDRRDRYDRERDRRSPKHFKTSSRSPERGYWKARKLEKKTAVLNKLGIELKPNVAQPLTPQLLGEQLKNQIQEVEAKTGVTLPTYYNPGVMNPMKYAQQIQKRKLLWGNKSAEAKTPNAAQVAGAPAAVKQWEAATFKGDQDGKMTEKFKRLMGIKGEVSAASGPSTDRDKPPETKEIIEKQEEMFSNMEAQYQVARMATHTHRGVGLGFGTFQVPPR